MASATILRYLIVASLYVGTTAAESPDTWNISSAVEVVRIGETVDVTCTTNTLLYGCQFILQDINRKDCEPVMIFDIGNRSDKVYGPTSNNPFFKATYQGVGVRNIDLDNACGIRLQILKEMPTGTYVLGCRGRKMFDLWMYEYMTLNIVNDSTDLNTGSIFVNPRYEVVKEGDSVSVECGVENTELPADSCSFFRPGRSDWLNVSSDRREDYNRRVATFDSCKITIANVTESDNGFWFCNVSYPPGSVSLHIATQIIIYKPPKNETQTLDIQPRIIDGSTCLTDGYVIEVRPYHPVAWWLGLRSVKSSVIYDNDRWLWAWNIQIVHEQMHTTVRMEDDATEVICVANSTNSLIMQYSLPLQVFRKYSFKFGITPQEKITNGVQNNGPIMCQADAALAVCQFILKDVVNKTCNESPTIDLSKGHKTKVKNVSWCQDNHFQVSYRGTGLKDGQCGVLLENVVPGIYKVGCRAGAKEGGWAYAEMDLYVHNDDDLLEVMSVHHPDMVVKPNSDVSSTFFTRTGEALPNHCSFYAPSSPQIPIALMGRFRYPTFRSFYARSSPQEPIAFTGRFRYDGTRLDAGVCSFNLTNAQNEDNGLYVVRSVTVQEDTNVTRNYVAMNRIIVLGDTFSSTLFVDLKTADGMEGDVVKATCVVNNSRPVALVTWFLGDDVLRRDAVNDERDVGWRWSWDTQTITQNVLIKLRLSDDDKLLRCVAESLTTLKSEQSTYLVSVLPYRSRQIAITAEGHTLKLGQSSLVRCSSTDYGMVLEKCQFTMREVGLDDGQDALDKSNILDFSLRERSPAFTMLQNNETFFKVIYEVSPDMETDISQETCGVDLTIYGGKPGLYVFGCRAIEWGYGWMYNYKLLEVNNGSYTLHESKNTSKRSIMSVPGSSENIACFGELDTDHKVPKPSCGYLAPGGNDFQNYNDGLNTSSTTSETKKPHGKCNIKINSTTLADNGLAICKLVRSKLKFELSPVEIIIANPPTAVELTLHTVNRFIDGDTLRATCVARDIRPYAPISWYLGERKLPVEEFNTYALDEEWRWPWDLQTVTRDIVWNLRLDNDGKQLRCVVEHVMLKQTYEAGEVVHVYRKWESPLTIDPLVMFPSESNNKVVCQYDAPIEFCQFKITFSDNDPNCLDPPLIELTSDNVDETENYFWCLEQRISVYLTGSCGMEIISLAFVRDFRQGRITHK